MAMNVPKVLPLCIMVFPMPPISSRAPHSDPETGKVAKGHPCRHAHGATRHEAHLHMVEAACLGLSMGTHGHWHLARGFGRSDLRLTRNPSWSALSLAFSMIYWMLAI